MGFDSIAFLSCFLPVCLLLYYCVPGIRGKNGVLILLSLVFYAFSGISAVYILLAVWAVNYLLGLGLQKGIAPKAVLIFGITANLVCLIAFKYAAFFLQSVLGLPQGTWSVAAPLGISFFLFKSISYLVDTYRNPIKGTKKPLRLLLYLSFHQP